MRIRFHKILAEGRSVRYDRDRDEEDILDLNVIVLNRSQRTRDRSRHA